MDAHRGGTALGELHQQWAGSTGRRPALPSPRPRSRPAARPVPERDEAYAHLSLVALRAYRHTLSEEESRVSYWRRLLQARLDVLRAGLAGASAHPLDTASLRPALSAERVGAGRRVLLDVVPAEGMPPLPQLEQLWEQQADPADPVASEALERELHRAERALSDYRAALHRRLGSATGELIARYRESPILCLSALPLPPERRVAAG